MEITFSSLFITVLVSSLMILILTYLMKNTNKLKIFRTDFFTVLILIIVLRLLYPSELPFTKTIPFSVVMNPLTEFFNYNLIHGLTILDIALYIWGIGSVLYTLYFLYNLLVANYIFKKIKKNAEIYQICDFLSDYEDKNYTVMLSDFVSSPMVFGFRKIIFLPKIKFSEIDLYNIIHHEVQHLKNKDLYIKLFINILIIIYWWFPPVYALSKNIDLFLEIRVDDQVTRKMSSQSRIDYADSLIHVQKKLKKQTDTPFSSALFIKDSSEILSYRVHYLLDGDFIKKTKSIFLVLLCILPFLSNMIIFEAAYYDCELTKGTLSNEDLLENGYILQHKDGSYSLILNKQEIKYGDSIPKDFSQLPVITEKE